MSAPFRFGLERVRDLRAHDEELAKEQFAATLSQRLRGEALLRAAGDRVRTARGERTRADAEVRLRGLDADLGASRAGLTDASRKREVLDKLEQRQRAAHV